MVPTDFSSGLAASRLRELLEFDPETGIFRRRFTANRWPAGMVAGYKVNTRYIHITIGGRAFLAHRLAWLWMTGAWPANQIDHINGDPADNRFSNLREVNISMNSQNQRRARSDSTSGLLGVYRKDWGWAAGIGVHGINRYLGTFATKELAHAAYLVAKRKWHEGCMI